jgi:hypothetical protein
MATIPEIEARIHALWTKGDARTREEAVELGRRLTALETDMPPGDFSTHVLEVLPHARACRAALDGPVPRVPGGGERPAPEGSQGSPHDAGAIGRSVGRSVPRAEGHARDAHRWHLGPARGRSHVAFAGRSKTVSASPPARAAGLFPS